MLPCVCVLALFLPPIWVLTDLLVLFVVFGRSRKTASPEGSLQAEESPQVSL